MNIKKRRKKNKKILAIIILLLLLGITVGYAALSQALIINGTARITSDWNISFKSITLTNSSGAMKNEPVLNKEDTSITFDISLEKPGSYVEYEIVVENKGSIAAKLEKISNKAEIDEFENEINVKQPTDIVYSIEGPEVGSIIKQFELATYVIRVEWISSSTQIPEIKSKTAKITLDYVQAD